MDSDVVHKQEFDNTTNELSLDIQVLSSKCNTLSNSIDNLDEKLSSLSNDLTTTSSDLNTLSTNYNDFIATNFAELSGSGEGTYAPCVVGESGGSGTEPDKYYLTFKGGTLVLIKK
jgi:hypothetical protein